MKPVQIAAYLFLAVTWGFSFVMLLHVVEAFGWAGAVALRGLLSGGLLVAAARLTGRRLDFSVGWESLSVVGATTVAGQLIFLSLATPRIGTAMASIFVAAIPLFSMVIGQVWGIERVTRRGLAGIVLGVAGIVMLVGFPAVPVTTAFLAGCAASLLSAFFAAYGSNHVARNMRGVGAWELTIGSSLVGGLIALPLLAFAPFPRAPAASDFAWLFALAAIVSALNYVIYFRLVVEIGATRAISVEFLVTVVAVLVGTVLLGEKLSPMQFAGAGVIILGCALVLGLIPDLQRRTAGT